jgi:SAM-dependent methyltransferase
MAQSTELKYPPLLEYLNDKVSMSDRVLDVASKDGSHMDLIPAKTINIDIAFNSVDGETEFIKADGGQLPFKSDSFDFVFCNQVLEHVPHKRALIFETSRVLKNGGEAIFSFPNRLAPTKPHSTPRYYSYLPAKIGDRLAFHLLDDETASYYITSEFVLSPILARMYLHRAYGDVQYMTFSPERQKTRARPLKRTLTRLCNIVPLLLYPIELFWPGVEYVCKKPRIEGRDLVTNGSNDLVADQKRWREGEN